MDELPEFRDWPEDEFNCLNLNIAVPPESSESPTRFPVMVYIHGGAYWFGGNFHPIYDVAALTSHSVRIGKPVVAISINYRLGLGGFLASSSIKEDLKKDGFTGVGNFALTDQQTALEWVQRYIAEFRGDSDNVTIFGESAGGISVAHQVAAARPAKFKQAIQMSGSLKLVENWSLERHQERYDRLCRRFDIDPAASDALERLRQISEQDLNIATLKLEASDFSVYNPCDDGVFHAAKPDLEYGRALPSWLQAIMIGDTADEGELWRHVVNKYELSFLVDRMKKFMSASEAEKCLEIYEISSQSSRAEVVQGFVHIIGDMMFKMQNFVIAHNSHIPRTFAYHVDQASTLDNMLKGQAYHAIDLLYVFLNGRQIMSPEQISLAERMASDWITFANGEDPFDRFPTSKKWRIYGPRNAQNSWEMQDEEQDEACRHYSRWRSLLDHGLYEKLWNAVEDIAYERCRIEGPVNGEAK